MEKCHLIVEEAEETVFSDICSCENITAHESHVFCRVVIELLEILHADARKCVYISRLDSLRTCYGNLSGHVVLACVEELSDSGEKQKRYCPYSVTLHDRGDVADLYSYIACRMFSAEHMLDNVLDLVERGAGVIVAAKREMYAAVRKFAESIDTGLDVCDFILECEFRDSRKRSGCKC